MPSTLAGLYNFSPALSQGKGVATMVSNRVHPIYACVSGNGDGGTDGSGGRFSEDAPLKVTAAGLVTRAGSYALVI